MEKGTTVTRRNHQLKEQQAEKAKQGLYWCSKCKQWKERDQFNKDSNNPPYYVRLYCKACVSVTRNKAYHKTYFKKRTYTIKYKYVHMMGGQCQKCGYKEYISALEFHHVYPEHKEIEIPLYTGTEQQIVQELDKCVLLCSNCHKGITGNEWNGKFSKAPLGYKLDEYWAIAPPIVELRLF